MRNELSLDVHWPRMAIDPSSDLMTHMITADRLVHRSEDRPLLPLTRDQLIEQIARSSGQRGQVVAVPDPLPALLCERHSQSFVIKQAVQSIG